MCIRDSHHITVLGKENEPCDHKYDMTGGLYENNDKFAIDRMLPKIDKGDILYIQDVYKRQVYAWTSCHLSKCARLFVSWSRKSSCTMTVPTRCV